MRWLPCLTCLYPAYWLGSSCVHALPAFLTAAFLRSHVEILANWTGMFAQASGMRTYFLPATAGALALILVILFLVSRVQRAVAGWLAIAVGSAGLWRFATFFLFGSGRRTGVWIGILFLIPVSLGIRWLFRQPRPGWGAAVAVTVLAVVLGVCAKAFERQTREQRRASERALLESAPPLPRTDFPRVIRFQKGVNFTAEAPGGYFSGNVQPMLQQLRGMGVDAIALIPYGSNRKGSPQIGMNMGMERDEGIERVSRIAHALGMSVMLKPQLWIFPGFPGDQEFANDSDRRAWFEQYLRFAEHNAELARRVHADVLCVGVEFVKLTRYESDWRRIIARSRELYPGPLVYAATQGDEFENVKFWDALDYVGLNDYYPLPDSLAMNGVLQRITAVQSRYKKPVILTEVGFTSMIAPHKEPWGENPRAISMEDQARCYESLLRAMYKQPWLAGMYWWKVGTDGHGGPDDGSFTPWKKPAMQVLSMWYARPR